MSPSQLEELEDPTCYMDRRGNLCRANLDDAYANARVEPLDMRKENQTFDLTIPEEGMVLHPGVLYLGRTVERVGTTDLVPYFEGRSSVGRLGIHVHCTAPGGAHGWVGTVTLELHVLHPVRIYAGERICQAIFLTTIGTLRPYAGRYQDQVEPTASRFHLPVGAQGTGHE